MLLFIIASFALGVSMFYSKILFRFENLNPMEACYVNSLSVFSITLLVLLTYINNWFRSYRNKTHAAMNRFQFPDTPGQSESIQNGQTANNSHNSPYFELKDLGNDSPKSLKYNDMSMSQSSGRPYYLANDGSAHKSENQTAEEKEIIIQNDHIMHYLKVQPVFRDNLFVSCACCVAGSLLVTNGLHYHLLSFTMLCVGLITPVVTTIVFASKIGLRWMVRTLSSNEEP